MVKIPLCGRVRSGGCQCGAVRYSITVEYGKAGICHCRMCQKAFALLHTLPGSRTEAVIIPVEALEKLKSRQHPDRH